MSTGPKWSRASLDVINNTYVIRNGLLYEYYPISCEPYKETDKFIKLLISPGIMSPGVAIVGKELYEVTLEDLFRRRINVARKHGGSSADANVSSESTSKKGKSRSKFGYDPNKPKSSSLSGNQVSEAADVAWQNQVDSLLQTIFAEEGEEFEITGSSQSGQADANSTVPDIFEDIELD